MRTHHSLHLAAFTILSSLAIATNAHADRVIDSFTDALPNAYLPGSSTPSPMLWTGTFNGVTRYQDDADQTGLQGVVGGERYTLAVSSNSNNFVQAVLVGGELSYASGLGGSSGVLELEYGGASDLNADLASDGSLALELEIDGDMDASSPQRVVWLTVEAASGSGSSAAQVQVPLVADGVYQIPFSSFTNVDFTDIDFLRFTFDASQYTGIDYVLLGGLRTTNCVQPAGSAVADIFLDTFESALPSRDLPGYGMMPFMWVGTFGTAQKYSDVAQQYGVDGTFNGQRRTTLQVSNIQNFITAYMGRNDGTGELSYATGYPTSGRLTLDYGYPSALNLDLSQMNAFELEIDGDLNDGGTPRPVPLTVTVYSNTGAAATQITLLADGTYRIPFSSFSGVNFGHVNRVKFYFNAGNVQAVDYTLIGGMRASVCSL